MYHSIGNKVAEVGAELYCVPEASFREQMEYVHNLGTVPYGGSPLITFDDGDMTNYTKAYPILKELGMKAHFFIIGEWVGRAGYMGWKEITELKSNGMTIGSHGMTHRLLTTLKNEELDYELKESKRILEDNLNISITSLSIPRGFHNKKVMDMAKAAGYDQIFTSKERIVVRADWNMEQFVDMLNGKYSWRQRAWDFIKSSSRELLGDENYDKLRTKVLR
ncbi:MAG: polysaccharide deacetylase family protein [Candidatus Omnitrophota bacterium]|nr:polysaccharide deacetylase family protein [Candidatus Omnitrophota bacterium]